jgi:hypothetical protein
MKCNICKKEEVKDVENTNVCDKCTNKLITKIFKRR